jgi:hypothetical protein
MTAAASPHATRALLRAHLSAAVGYRHLTGQCPVCRRLLRLAMEPSAPAAGDEEPGEPPAAPLPAEEAEATAVAPGA